MSRRRLVLLLVPIDLLVLAIVLLAWQARPLTLWLMTPAGPFDATAAPAAPQHAPDYAQDEAWLARPDRDDEADVALSELPATTSPAVDVFYLHPTSSIAPTWNAAADDPAVRAASIRGGTLIQASAFNGSGAVYAPAYRQASGVAFITPSADGDAAIDLAYGDVVAAWRDFNRRTGGTRPFLLVGHSQGALLAARLLREHIVNGPDRERLVAAWLIGAPLVAADIAPLRPCSAPDETGCVVAYNARGPDHEKNVIELGRGVPEEQRLCVNPTLGTHSGELVPRARHGGAVFFDADRPALLPAFLASQCRDGRLVVTELQPLPPRDVMSAILLRVMGTGNHHPIEVQLFYADLRADAARRVAAHQRRAGAGRTSP